MRAILRADRSFLGSVVKRPSSSLMKSARRAPSTSAERKTPASVRCAGMRPCAAGFSQYPKGGMPVMMGRQPMPK